MYRDTSSVDCAPRELTHAVQITMWDPSLTMQCQLADSIKPQTLGVKSTT